MPKLRKANKKIKTGSPVPPAAKLSLLSDNYFVDPFNSNAFLLLLLCALTGISLR